MRATPQIMLEADVDAVIGLWQRAFPELGMEPLTVGADERVTYARLTLAGLDLLLLERPGSHDFGPTPAVSLLVEVDRAEDVDRVAEILGEGGEVLMPLGAYDFAARYVWVQDRYGVSWQIAWDRP